MYVCDAFSNPVAPLGATVPKCCLFQNFGSRQYVLIIEESNTPTTSPAARPASIPCRAAAAHRSHGPQRRRIVDAVQPDLQRPRSKQGRGRGQPAGGAAGGAEGRGQQQRRRGGRGAGPGGTATRRRGTAVALHLLGPAPTGPHPTQPSLPTPASGCRRAASWLVNAGHAGAGRRAGRQPATARGQRLHAGGRPRASRRARA